MTISLYSILHQSSKNRFIPFFVQKLDSINEAYISHNQGKKDIPQDHHQGLLTSSKIITDFQISQTFPDKFICDLS